MPSCDGRLMADRRFPPKHHIRRGGDFDRVFKRRCSASDGRLLVFGDFSGLSHSRLGLSVSRKVGGAVVRNRWKRLIREAFRLSREKLPVGIDLVVIPRPVNKPELAGLIDSLTRLADQVAGKLARRDR